MKAQNLTSYIQHELTILDQKLAKDGDHLKLTNEQTTQLTKLLQAKGTRIEYFKSKYPHKDEMSVALIQLEEEFTPRIQAVLNAQQRMVLQKLTATK